MTHRAIRCTECGERFYTDTPKDLCQNCEGSHDPFAATSNDAENIVKANTLPKSRKPQSVDPRTGKGADEEAQTTSTTEEKPVEPKKVPAKKAEK